MPNLEPEIAELRVRVDAADAGQRLDHLVARSAGVSRRVARTWIAAGRVFVAGKPLRILGRPIRAGAEIAIRPGVAGGTGEAPAGPGAPACTAGHTPIQVLFVDRHLLVVDKPAGLLSEHDRFGSPSVESLAGGILARRGERAERTRTWLVHRLDAGTSGVLVLARTPTAARRLGEAFRAGTVTKSYLALCRGSFGGRQTIEAPIARAERTRHVVSPGGRPASTTIVGLVARESASLVRAEPHTGRTHQIRVHLAHLGHPLLGDGLYGGPMYTPDRAAEPIGRPMLHAARLRLPHPQDGALAVFTAPPPRDFTELAARLDIGLPEGWESP